MPELELTDEQKQELIEQTKDKVIESVKADTKTEVEEVAKLVNELRENIKLMEEGKLTKSEYEEREKKIEERIDQVEIENKRHVPEIENKDEKSPEMKAFDSYLRKGVLEPEEKKVLTIADDTGLGYLAPSEYVNAIIKGVIEISPMRSLATVRTTSRNSIDHPKRTGTFSAGWVAEIGTKTETEGLIYGLESIPTHEMYAFVKVSQQSLEDSAFNLEAELMSEFIEQFGYAEGTAFITGDSIGKPEGILTNSDVVKTTVVYDHSDLGFLIDGMIDLIYGIKSVYSKVAKLLANRASIAYLRKMKDSNNKYYWEPNFQAGTPGAFLGVPIAECVDMPAASATAYPVAYGDFKRGYLIVDRVQIAVQRLVERYAELGQVGFIARKRVGGQVVLAEAIQAGVGQA